MTKIDKYWSNEFMKWIEGYKIFGIYFIKLSLYKEKNKYKIVFKLTSRYNSFYTNEFNKFLNSIRNGQK